MTFEHFWVLVLKHWMLIIGCFVIAGLGTFVVSKLTTPLYQSTAVVQIAIRSGSNQADINSLLASDQLVQTEAQLAVSDPVLREVASHYPGMTVDQLLSEVTASPKLNTQLFEINVVNASPTRAAALANDVAATLIKQQFQVIQQNNLQSQQQIQQDLDNTRKQINDTTTRIATLQAKGGNQAQITVLEAQLNSLQQHYSQWQTALAQLELNQAQSGDFLRIAQPAQPALRPVRPNVLLNTGAGLVAGLFLGILLALLLEQLDTHVRTPEMLTQLLQWPVLATVWRSRTANRQEIVNPGGHDANVEAYRILRTNIGFAGIDKPLKSLMVTSAQPNDGKSVIAANLAVFLAKAGKSTLLIDADLRRPVQHQLFNLAPEKMGLSNAVLAYSMQTTAPTPQFMISTVPGQPSSIPNAAYLSLEPFVHDVGIPNLRVMPSGPLPPNPSELLDSKAMQRLFVALAGCGAEVVIFDTPPVQGLSDACILTSKVDGTLVVVDAARATKGTLKQMKTLLTQAGGQVIGCVMNKQRRSRHDTSYSYYYYYRSDAQDGERNQNGKHAGASGDPTNVLHAAKNAVLPLTGGKKGRPR